MTPVGDPYTFGTCSVFHSLSEAHRKDPHSTDFLESLQDILPALAPVFDRAPKYAWIAKQLMEPERAIQFRVVRAACKPLKMMNPVARRASFSRFHFVRDANAAIQDS